MRWLSAILVLSISGLSAGTFAQTFPTSQPSARAKAQTLPTSQPSAIAAAAKDAYRAERKKALVAYFQAVVDADKQYLSALSDALKLATQRGDLDSKNRLNAVRIQVTEDTKEDNTKLAAAERSPNGELIQPEPAVSNGRVILLSAIWGAEDRTADVTTAVRKIITTGSSAFANNDVLGTDPYPGTTKMLHIRASVDGVNKSWDLWEGMSFPPELFSH